MSDADFAELGALSDSSGLGKESAHMLKRHLEWPRHRTERLTRPPAVSTTRPDQQATTVVPHPTLHTDMIIHAVMQ
ncbi:hypothetical protein [Nocardia grenadensis]|uniref:hypothetical protein n=1 Tax=Nocardia grenadensis TaxID=931537 RepID=UPI003D746567